MTINPHSLFLTCFISLAANHTQSCRQTFYTLFWGPSHALGPPARHSLEGSWDEGDEERVIEEPLGAAPGSRSHLGWTTGEEPLYETGSAGHPGCSIPAE